MNYRADWIEKSETDGHYAIATALIDVAYALRALSTSDAAVQLGDKIEMLNNSIIEVGSVVGEAIDRN